MGIKLEIVAPAGNPSKLRAAIKAGAFSVYLGLKGYGARLKAGNFTLEEFKEAIDYCHLRGVKTYLTLNTLMKDIEIEKVYPKIKELYEYGLDAIIVQDIGVFRFLKDNFPDIDIHASTQMTASNHKDVLFLENLGFKRVVLSRELSFEEIKSIREKTKIELEIFVSGANCISYSGNCYFSSFIGARSGNRGLCAQPCRKSYIADEKEAYYLSPKDNILGEEEIKKLAEIGVESIKVEGRMKSEEYVYSMVSYYKNILENKKVKFETDKIFNRAYTKSYFYDDCKSLINKEYSFDFGKLTGKILKNNNIKLSENLSLGDGIVFVDENKKVISGTYVNKIFKNNKEVKFAETNDEVKLNAIPKETVEIYKNYDKYLNDSIKQNLKTEERKLNINAELVLKLGEKARFIIKKDNIELEEIGEIVEKSENRKLTDEILIDKLGIGNTNLAYENLILNYDESSFISFKELKEIKRNAVDKFCEKYINSFKRNLENSPVFIENIENKEEKDYILSVSIRDEKYIDIVKKYKVDKIYIKTQDVIKEKNIDKLKETNLVSNFSELLLSKENVSLDWNMNTFNSYAFKEYSKINNIGTIFLSPELSIEEIEKINSFSLKKGLLVYSMPRLMYIYPEIFKGEKKEFLNLEGDKFYSYKNKLGDTEIYIDIPLDIRKNIGKIKGINEYKIEFNFETEEEIKNILSNTLTLKSNFYNYKEGVY